MTHPPQMLLVAAPRLLLVSMSCLLARAMLDLLAISCSCLSLSTRASSAWRIDQ